MLRDLHTIDYLEATSEIEAAVLENRAIAELKPLYNKRSKPPKSLHWVKLTQERFPRLSIARSPGDSPMALGPFRNRRSAEEVMHGLWDATRIRRCTGRGKGCGFAQLGQAVCPCDGSVSTGDYAGIVDELIAGVKQPELLIGHTRSRMERLAGLQRFEDAALVRDRWGALARAIHRSRVWNAFQDAGEMEVSGPGGVTLLLSQGRMSLAWRTTETRPLTLASTTAPSKYPPSMAAIDEAMLLWKWLSKDGSRVVSVEGTLALSTSRIPALNGGRSSGISVPPVAP